LTAQSQLLEDFALLRKHISYSARAPVHTHGGFSADRLIPGGVTAWCCRLGWSHTFLLSVVSPRLALAMNPDDLS
jgi:hypothetical protein